MEVSTTTFRFIISQITLVLSYLILKLQVEFEDKIITDRAAWVETGVSPFGQAPLLEVDGKPIAQTGAIARYCGKLSGHYPKVIVLNLSVPPP